MSRITVGISDRKVCRAPDELATYALGSCVAVCLWDSTAKVAGMAHIMLPNSEEIPNDNNVNKFADTAIKRLYEDMLLSGASKGGIIAKAAGGANMLGGIGILSNIGERNAEAVTAQLKRLGIPLVAEDMGLNYGRTVYFRAEDGQMTVTSGLKGTKII